MTDPDQVLGRFNRSAAPPEVPPPELSDAPPDFVRGTVLAILVRNYVRRQAQEAAILEDEAFMDLPDPTDISAIRAFSRVIRLSEDWDRALLRLDLALGIRRRFPGSSPRALFREHLRIRSD